MAVVLSNETSLNLKDLKGKQFSEIFVKVVFADKTTGYVSLADLCDDTGRRYFQPSETTDHAALFESLQAMPTNLYIKVDEHSIKRITSLNNNLMFEHTQVSTDLSTEQSKMVFGLQQKLAIAETQSDYNQNTKVFVKLKGDNDFKLVDAKDVYIFVDGTSVCLADLKDQTLLNEIQNNNVLENVKMYVYNREIVVLDKSKFEQEAVINQESYEYTAVDGKTVLMHKGLDDDGLKPVEDGVVKRKYVDYNSTGGKDLRVVQSQKYLIDSNHAGNHIYVQDKQGKKYFVAIDDLFTGSIASPQPIDVEMFLTMPENNVAANYLNYVGQPLLLKTGSTYVELAPLTIEQATKVYKNTTFTPTAVYDKNVIAKPGVYRQTVDGKYFEESNIQPLCYDYADGDAGFTDYLFNVTTADQNFSIIVPRQQFIDKSRVQVKVENAGKTEYVYVGLTDAVRPRQLVRVNKSVETCAVVQTSTVHNQQYNQAVVLKDINTDDVLSNATTEAIKQQFLEDYKDGKYIVNSTYNQYGDIVEFKQTNSRFVMTDYIEMLDRNGEDTYYQNFKAQTLTLKNGRFEGKPTFDSKRANKSYSAGAKSFALTSLKLMFTPLGILTMVALPALPVVSFAAALSIPVVNVANKVRENISKAGVKNATKDPQQINREKSEQTIFENIAKLLKQTEFEFETGKQQSAGANVGFGLSDKQLDSIREAMLLLQEQINANYEKENASNVLHVVNGEAEINAQNAHLAYEYEKMLAGLNADIKGLQRQIRRAKGAEKERLQEILNEKLAARDAMVNEYTLSSDELAENQQAKQNALDLLTLAKAMIVAKYTNIALDEQTKQFVYDLKIDFAANKIKYKGKRYKSVADLFAANEQVKGYIDTLNSMASRLDSVEHKDINNKPLVLPETDIVSTNLSENQQAAEMDNTFANEQTSNVNSTIEQANETNQLTNTPDNQTDDNLVEKTTQQLGGTFAEQDIAAQLEEQTVFIDSLLNKADFTEEDAKVLSAHIDDLTNKSTELKSQAEAANAAIAAITGTTDEVKTGLNSAVSDLKTFADNLEKCNNNIEKLKKLIVGKMSTEQASSITEKIVALQQIVIGYQDQIGSTINQVTATIENLNNNPDLNIAEFESQIQNLQFELEDIKSKFVSAQSDLNTNEVLIQNLKSRLDALKDEKKNISNTLKTLSADKAAAQTNIELLDKQIIELESQIAEKQHLIDEQEGNIILHIEDIQHLKAELKQAEENLLQFKNNANDLTQQIEDLKLKMKSIEAENSNLQQKYDQLKQVNIELTDINKQLTEQNKNQANKINELDNVVASLKAAIEKAEQGLNSNQNSIEQVEIQNLKNRLAAVEAKRDELQIAYNNSREELSKQKQAYEEQIENLKHQIAEKDAMIYRLQEKENKYRLLAKQLANKNQSIIDAADETIIAISQLLDADVVDETVIKRIKNNIISGKLYGLKTEIDDLKETTTLTLGKVEKEIKMAATRIASLETLIAVAADENDQDLQDVAKKANEKITQLKEKQEQLKRLQPKIKKLADSFVDLKEYVDLVKVQQDINKTILDAKFSLGLTPNESDIKYLVAVIVCFKNAIKQQKLIEKGIAGRSLSFDTAIIAGDLQTMIEQMQQFIRSNYNVFNLCNNQNVKEKYYDKVSSYSKYDHSVLFSMPDDRKHDGSDAPTADDNL